MNVETVTLIANVDGTFTARRRTNIGRRGHGLVWLSRPKTAAVRYDDLESVVRMYGAEPRSEDRYIREIGYAYTYIVEHDPSFTRTLADAKVSG